VVIAFLHVLKYQGNLTAEVRVGNNYEHKLNCNFYCSLGRLFSVVHSNGRIMLLQNNALGGMRRSHFEHFSAIIVQHTMSAYTNQFCSVIGFWYDT
jgi:hypothetical protein